MIWLLTILNIVLLIIGTNNWLTEGVSSVPVQSRKYKPVGKLPVLGFNTWNYLGCNLNESIILSTIDLMESKGLIKVGYNQFNLDDCWSLIERDSEGHLVPDPIKFPSGLKSISNILENKGMNMGLYGDNGYKTCQFPGSYGHELTDARDFVKWGANLLKFDNCHMVPDRISQENEPGKYTSMRDAIITTARETGIKLQLNLCEWGVVQPWLWGKEYGTSWRATTDIAANWESIMAITNIASFIPGYTDFYGRNDFDILEIGNGELTFEEAKSHFTVWALTKSHLLLSTNLEALSQELLEVITNKKILAINQDDQYGTGISPFRWTADRNPPYQWGPAPPIFLSDNLHPAALWSGRTLLGAVVLILNTYSSNRNISFDLVESPWLRAGIQYKVQDVYSGENFPLPMIRNFTTSLESHAVQVLLMHEDGIEPEGSGRDCQALEGFNCGM